MPELTLEEKKVDYEQQIKSLEAEIKLLEDELKRRDQPIDIVTDDQLEQAMWAEWLQVKWKTFYKCLEI